MPSQVEASMRIGTALAVFALALAGCASPPAEPAAGTIAPGTLDRPSTLGAIPYDGPTTPEGLKAHCGGGGYEAIPCYVETLQAYLHDAGSVAAFRLLDDLTRADAAVNQQAHAISHELGQYALKVYGTIELTLAECSYEVFQGCLHGALQGYFNTLEEVRPEDYRDVCPTDTRFREYACLHGLGHGLTLYTRYDLNRSLAMCDGLRDDFARGSCQGGAFMENMVAYMDHQNPVAGVGHVHGDTEEVEYMIDPEDPFYPCNVVNASYQTTCWLLQTSLILYLNGGDFRRGAEACENAPFPHAPTCYRSLGRDASAYANSACGARADACYVRDVTERCSHGSSAGRALCMKGAVAEVVLNFASPEPGLTMCKQVQAIDKEPCVEELAAQARNMVDADAMRDLCSRVEPAYQEACWRWSGLR